MFQLYLLALILFQSGFANPVAREVLQEANRDVFAAKSIRLELLKDHPEMIPVLAQWQFNDWHSYDTTLTLEKLVKYFEEQSGLSFTIVALKEEKPIGSISLDEEGEPEFSDLFGTGPWPGSFHVLAEERKNRIGSELGKVILTIAKRLGYKQVNFFTSKFSNVAGYVKKGAQIVDTRPFRGHTVTVMKMPVENFSVVSISVVNLE